MPVLQHVFLLWLNRTCASAYQLQCALADVRDSALGVWCSLIPLAWRGVSLLSCQSCSNEKPDNLIITPAVAGIFCSMLCLLNKATYLCKAGVPEILSSTYGG
jgi:hypothetical protein